MKPCSLTVLGSRAVGKWWNVATSQIIPRIFSPVTQGCQAAPAEKLEETVISQHLLMNLWISWFWFTDLVSSPCLGSLFCPGLHGLCAANPRRSLLRPRTSRNAWIMFCWKATHLGTAEATHWRPKCKTMQKALSRETIHCDRETNQTKIQMHRNAWFPVVFCLK